MSQRHMADEDGRLLDATRERVVATTVYGARSLASDPLFQRLLDVDPELLLPYVTQRLGGMQRMVVAGLAEQLADADGSVRTDVPPAVLAAGVELLSRGFVLAPPRALGPPHPRGGAGR